MEVEVLANLTDDVYLGRGAVGEVDSVCLEVINAGLCNDFSLRHELNISVRKGDSGLGGIVVGLGEFPSYVSYAYIDPRTDRDVCLALCLSRNTSRLNPTTYASR